VLAIDLYCGLGGWAEGFLAEGYRVIGFDIERHDYGTGAYPGELVLRDVRSLSGAELVREYGIPAVIVGSSPCQEFSYRAMPWKRAKSLPPPYLGMELFQAQFRIQREVSEAVGRYVPMVVENVRGAQKWVGRARWHYGSFYLWGDVPALMPMTIAAQKFNPDGTEHGTGSWFAVADSKNRGASVKTCGLLNIRDGHSHTRHLTNPAEHRKNDGGSWFTIAHNTKSGHGRNPVTGTKVTGDWFGSYADMKAMGTISPGRMHGKNSAKRKAASAMIAKIPFPLAQHIAKCFASQSMMEQPS
jgi:hypothetical protein